MLLSSRPTPLALLALLALSGCSATLHLYPIRGPLAALVPPPVLPIVATGLASGTFTLTLPDGERCTGPWAHVPPGSPAGELAPVWDEVYGPGFHTAHILGAPKYGRGELRGSRGTVLRVEFFLDTPEHSPLQGVAQDSLGNRYKFTR